MQPQRGAGFNPYDKTHSLHLRTPPEKLITIPTLLNVEPLLQEAAAREDARFEQGDDDSEGLGVTSRPLTPLTEIESDDEAEAPAHPCPASGSGMQPDAKKRRKAGAKERRTKKRVRLASSGHQPHGYAANPSTTAHHSEELKPLRVPFDAEGFPASGSGSWVGQRSDVAKKVPWTVPELVKKGFTFVKWDGL